MDAWKVVAALALLDAWCASVRRGPSENTAALSAQIDAVVLGMTADERREFVAGASGPAS
jgi:hypothetical protein